LYFVDAIGTERLNSSPDVRDTVAQLAHGGLTHRRPQTPGDCHIRLSFCSALLVESQKLYLSCKRIRCINCTSFSSGTFWKL